MGPKRLLVSSYMRTSLSKTTAAAADDDDDDASQRDVIAPHPEHLLLNSLGSCSPTKSVL